MSVLHNGSYSSTVQSLQYKPTSSTLESDVRSADRTAESRIFVRIFLSRIFSVPDRKTSHCCSIWAIAPFGSTTWLDVRDRVTFKLVVIVHRCLKGTSPFTASQRHLRSTERYCTYHVTDSTRTAEPGLLPIADTSAWNSPPDPVAIRTLPKLLSGAW